MARVSLGEAGERRTSRFAWGRVHSIETMGTVDGPGIRLVVFTQGCPMRCLYCHNPDTWTVDGGTEVSVEHVLDLYESNRAFYRAGGVTVSGGEPLLQPEFVGDLFFALHARPRGRVHTCLDTSGAAYTPENPARFERLLAETDLVLLDIKHADPARHRALTGRDPARIRSFGDELARRKIPVVIRHVVVPGWTDSIDECAKLGRLIAPWGNVVGLEMLPYHTMGVAKYEQLGIDYPLAGVPQQDKAAIPQLRQAVVDAMCAARTGMSEQA